ncbi:hypothetical protein F2Q70_00022184 [Brassica cretica]|uniref:Uncharacterized protein n=1 Tax=Brassica cretica TaxID=69181 RepID=A0A8S9GSP0_BRACR|nr:hypothetical protein F2Q70_00022184 [Brassica cretica]
MTRPFLEAWSLLLEFGLEGSEILVSLIDVGLGRRRAAFLRDDSRLELHFGRGSRFDLAPRSDLAVRVDHGLMLGPGLRFRLEGFIASGSFRPSHRYPLVQWVKFLFLSLIR